MKIKIMLLFTCISSIVCAQNKFQFVDKFDDNRNGWTEFVSKKSKVIVQDGVLLIESKDKKEFPYSYSFLGVSLKENFELSCSCSVKEITKDGYFGLIFNMENENNLCAFFVGKGTASLYENRNGVWKQISVDKIKLSDKKNQIIQLEIKNNFGSLSFLINGMAAISNVTGRINYSGFGFVVSGKQTAKFDNLKVVQ